MRLCLLLVLACLPALASARSIPVRSGEHADFTRLTLALPDRVDWSVKRDGAKAKISLEGDVGAFDTSAVFARISGSRLAGIGAAPGAAGLILTLNCDCDITGFWHGESMLVLDIRDPLAAAKEEPASQQPALANKPAGKAPDPPPSAAAALAAQALASPQPPGGTAEPENGLRRDMMLSLRHRLTRQVGRAASQGLLSPSWPPVGVSPTEPDPNTIAEREEPPSARQADEAARAPRNINLRAETSIDREMLAALNEAVTAIGADACLSDQRLDVRAWAADAPFAAQVGAARASLTSDLDRTNTAAVLELARLYIHFGFGAEAAATLRLVTDHPDRRMLLEMATILEGGRPPADGFFARQLECSTAGALWAVLSVPSVPAGARLDKKAVTRAFNALPAHLRGYLGPMVAERIATSGDRDVARRILDITERGRAEPSPAAKLARAEVDIAEGQEAEARAPIVEVAESNSEPSAEALLLLVDTHIANGEPLSFEHAQLVGAYAAQYRDDPLGQDLAQAHVAALAASEAFDEAFRTLRNETERIGPDIAGTRSTVAHLLAQKADDVAFARHALSGNMGPARDLEQRAANAVATRLLDLGFPERARVFVAAPADGALEEERQLLRARAALDAGRPRQAEADLIGRSDKAANALRARARSMMGQHDAAQALYRSAGLEEAAQTEAWQGEEWARLGATDDPALQKLRDVLADTAAPGNGQQDASLAGNRALLERSERMRDALEALLNRNQGPSVSELTAVSPLSLTESQQP